MDILKLQSQVWTIAEEKGWHKKKISFGDFISLCHAELSEAIEIYRKKGDAGISHVEPFVWLDTGVNGEDDMSIAKSPPEGIPIELADVIMRILDYCETQGIPMFQALEMKMNYNKTRSYRHGDKII